VVAHQVNQRLHCHADAHYACCQRAAREIATETVQQRGDPVQRQRVSELTHNYPCKR
jgi:hypothetical protein